MSYVHATRTPCTDAELIAALTAAYTSSLGHAPEHQCLAVILAQVALETGHCAALICWNLGNYKRGPGPNWCQFETSEYVGGVKTAMVCDFSAWPDLESAAAYFVQALYQHWPEAWTAAVHGDPEEFARGLRSRGYYTAPVELYAAGVKRWSGYYLALLGGDSAPTEPEIAIDPSYAAIEAIDGLLVSQRADTVPEVG